MHTLADTVLLLEWIPPSESERNGAIISYTLSCAVDDKDIFVQTVKATLREFCWGVYKREAAYTCEIYASTAVGGGPTASVTFTTEGSYCQN